MYRICEEGDELAVYRLVCVLEGKKLDWSSFQKAYRFQLSNPNYHCLVWEEDGLVAGMLNLRFERQLHHENPVAEILEFAVLEECRSRGIGRELFSQACTWAKERDCELIEVACNRGRTDAHRFYRALGMEESHLRFLLPLNEKTKPHLFEGTYCL